MINCSLLSMDVLMTEFKHQLIHKTWLINSAKMNSTTALKPHLTNLINYQNIWAFEPYLIGDEVLVKWLVLDVAYSEWWSSLDTVVSVPLARDLVLDLDLLFIVPSCDLAGRFSFLFPTSRQKQTPLDERHDMYEIPEVFCPTVLCVFNGLGWAKIYKSYKYDAH